MHTQGRTESKRVRAIEALKSVLTNVSGVKLRFIETDAPVIRQDIDILAQVEIYGHDHMLACMLVPNEERQQMHESVVRFCSRALKVAQNVTPVLIAPRLSSELQRLSRETKTGVVDFRGNARIELGEMFIACQRVSAPAAHRRALRGQMLKSAVHTGAIA